MKSVLVVLGTIVVLNVNVSGQQQLREQLVAVDIMFHGRALVYSSNSEEPIFFEGEEPLLSIRVHNNTATPLTLGSPGRPWVDDLAMSIQRLTGEPVAVRARLGRTPQTAAVLEPGRGDFLLVSVLPDAFVPLPPGRYRVEATLNPAALPPDALALDNVLSRREEFEIRSVDSFEAQLDLHLFRSRRAVDDGDLAAARKWLDSMLAMYANSFYAAYEMAYLWMREDNCTNAVPYLERALTILDTDADVLSKRRNPAYRMRSMVEARLTQCSGQ